MRVAAIGIGSNSLRMLIADVFNKELKQVVRDREGLRVFAALSGVDGGTISPSMISQASHSIYKMKLKAQDLGCKEIHLFATSATRDASNKDEFLNAIYNHTGLMAEVLSGEDEAKLSFYGSTHGKRAGMIDIGGGSTEIALGQGKDIEYSHSFQMGAVRLSRQVPIEKTSDIPEALRFANKILSEKSKEILAVSDKYRLDEFYGVGGTFTSTGAYLKNVSWCEYDQINGFKITKDFAYRCLIELTNLDLEQRMNLISIQRNRADIITHGVLILYSCMDFLNIDSITVSTKGNLEGYLYVKNIYA